MSAPKPIEIAIVNDYLIVVTGLATLLEPHADRVRIAEVGANHPVTSPVDVALFDTFACTAPRLDQLRELVDNPLVDRVVVFSWSATDQQVDEALRAGASGYVSKAASGERIVDCLERVVAGDTVVWAPGVRPPSRSSDTDLVWPGREFGLTAREAEVLALITQGKSNREIADALFLSTNTIKAPIRSAYRKIGVQTRVQAALWGIRNGMSPDVVQASTPSLAS